MKIVILKYNAGNTRSVYYALQRLNVEAIVTDDPELIKSSDKLIIPGVGEASGAMAYLRERQLDKLIVSLKQPVLGICLGMQLMCSFSQEGNTDCLGIFDADVKRFDDRSGIKVPQVGWNTISKFTSSLLEGVPKSSYMYFVHSYFVSLNKNTIAQTDYGGGFSAAIQNGNFYGVQFHPEKSSKTGQQLLKNFIQI